jgi:hypothetical protein
MVVNLEHVTNMAIEGKRIIFSFYTNSVFVDMESEELALNTFEQLINVWYADVLG